MTRSKTKNSPAPEGLDLAELDGVVGGKATRRSQQLSSWSTSGDADDRPTEEVAFYYNKIER